MAVVIGQIRIDKQKLDDFVDTAAAGIAQCQNDAALIASASTLADFRTIVDHINNRQLKIMQALKYLAENMG